MKVFPLLNSKNFINIFKKYKSTSIKFNEEKFSTQDYYIENMEVDKLTNFEEIKIQNNNKNNYIPEKEYKTYERISNIKAYQNSKNNLIVETINKNRDIKRTLSDKTDYSDDGIISTLDGIWNNNLKETKFVDLEELDNNKIDEFTNYVKNNNLEDFPKFNYDQFVEMSVNEYKKTLVEIINSLNVDIETKFKDKTVNLKEIKKRINQKFCGENKMIEEYFNEKRNNKRIVYGQTFKLEDKEINEALEFLNADSRIDFKNSKEKDSESINKFIPQTNQDRKKFTQFINLKSEVVYV